MARSTISFFVHPKHPLKIIASGATWLSSFGPMFQASPRRHEAKLRSAFALPHFNKLTVPIGPPDPMATLLSRDVRFCHTRFTTNRVTRLDAWETHVERFALPKCVDSGNLSVNKLVIRRMPV
jgi:hypothetical protein